MPDLTAADMDAAGAHDRRQRAKHGHHVEGVKVIMAGQQKQPSSRSA
jgi:hypothetical protein